MIDRDTPCPEGFPEHLWEGFKLYFLNGIRPGSFLTAFLCGDLFEVMGRGDDEAIAGLKPMVVYLHSRCPAMCYGSEKRVQEWCAMGGAEGSRGAHQEVTTVTSPSGGTL